MISASCYSTEMQIAVQANAFINLTFKLRNSAFHRIMTYLLLFKKESIGNYNISKLEKQ